MRKFIPVLVTCAGLYAYRNSFHGPFIFDDVTSILENPTIRQLWPPWRLMPPSGDATVGMRPIINLSLALNYAVNGLDVWGYHAFNLAIHILAALLLYGIVRRTLLQPGLRERYADAAPWLALAVTLIWLVHPLQTEAVTYIIQRTELLMGMFFLLTLYCLIRGVESARPRAWFPAAVAASVLGMGSKEVMAVAPVVVLAYDRLFLSTSFGETFRRRWGLYAGLAATWLIFGALLQIRIALDIPQLRWSGVTRWDYLKTQSGVIVHYLRLALWPDPLVADYDDWPLARSVAAILPSAVAVVMLLGLTLWAFHRRLRLAFLGVWFFLILAPSSSIWPLLTEFAAERRMYLPLGAVIVLGVLGGHAVVGKIWRRFGWEPGRCRWLEAVVLAVIAATLVQLTVRRNEDYRSMVSFWSDVVAKRPNNARGRLGMGAALAGQGRFEEASTFYSEALRIRPDNAEAHTGFGAALAHQGKIDEAIMHYSEALRIAPNYALAHYNLANELITRGESNEAIAHYSEALRIRPDYAEAHNNLGAWLMTHGNLQEAIAHYSEALRIRRDYAEAHNNMAAALITQGKPDEAIAHYYEALRINPNYAQAHHNLATEQARQGKLKEAIAHYSQALRIAPSAARHYNLATTLTRDGRTEEAIGHLEAALKLDPGFQPARRALQDLTSPGAK